MPRKKEVSAIARNAMPNTLKKKEGKCPVPSFASTPKRYDGKKDDMRKISQNGEREKKEVVKSVSGV